MKVFVSCVSKKHGNIVANIFNINDTNLQETFNEWQRQTKGGNPSENVYKGTQWELVKKINNKVKTYVVSAGYGIIDLTTPIVPYSITFSDAYKENKPILVPKFGLSQKETNKKWFNMFGDFSNLWEGNETYIFTVNPIYLNVLDLPKKDNIIILNNYSLGRLAKWLGTGANNLCVKFAEYIVNNHPNLSGNKELKSIVEDLDSKYGQDLYQKRKKIDDDFIINWIKESKTLKQLRDKGYSCSSQRFKKLNTKI